ncbi:MAG: DUF4297 domain-containing protein [Actinomycetota bacterium]|nr:DUF4297 domain-containing protein [Actinomycetota bacterium]
MADPAEGARRSRRGYWYQDLYALGRYLDLIDGTWDAVTVESDEDIVCKQAGPVAIVRYEQVKTVEDPDQLWSMSMVCSPEKGHPERSILGKLFTGKPLPEGTQFSLVLNENVNATLRALVRSEDRDAEAVGEAAARASKALASVSPQGDRSIEWCVERLEVDVRERTTDGLEDGLVRRIYELVARVHGVHLLGEELDDVLGHLMDGLQADARGPTRRTVDRSEMDRRLADACARVQGTSPAPTSGDSSRLRDKLRAAGLDPDEIEHCVEMHLAHRMAVRTADPRRKKEIQQLVDEVFGECVRVALERREGHIADGPAAFRATLDRVVSHYDQYDCKARGFALADLERAVHDITSRCRHRYAQ